MKNHNNLSFEQKSLAGWYATYQLTKKKLIFDFEQSKYKDYDKLANELTYVNRNISKMTKELNESELPIENINLLNNEIYTGLVNHNKLSGLVYYS